MIKMDLRDSRSSAVVTAFALSFASLAGCQAHVDLEAPTAAADSKQRLDAWDRLKTIEMKETHITYLKNGVPVGSQRTTDYLQLADGRRVYYPEDLLAVAGPNSATRRAVEEYDSQKTVGTWLVIGGVTFVAAGAGLALGSLAATDDDQVANVPMLIAGGATFVVGAVAGGIVAPIFFRNANDEKATAFVTYNDALMERLGLCPIDDKRIAPCELANEAQPAP